jgi:MFS family permease
MPRDVGAALAATIVGSLAAFLVGALAVQIRMSLHFGVVALGAAISLYYLGAGVGSVPSGRLAEAIGGVRVMRLAALSSALVLALMATVSSWASLLTLLLIAGMVSSATQPAANLFLARRIPSARQGVAFGIKQAAVPGAALAGGLAVPGLALTVGWRWAFAIGAGLAVVAAALVPRPRTSLAERRARPAARPRPGSLRPLVVLATGFGLGVFAATGLSAFIVISAVDAGASKGGAGLLAALGGAVAVVTRILSGAAADRRGRAHLPVVAAMLVTGAAGYAVLAVGAAGRIPALFVAGVVIAYGAGWGWNGLFNFAVVRTHPEAPARATAVIQVGGRLAGAIGPLSFGLVASHGSYGAAWAMNAAAVVAAAALILYGRQSLVESTRNITVERATSS